MSEHTLHMNMRCVQSKRMLHMEMWYVRTYVANENTLSCVLSFVTHKHVLCLNNCYTWVWKVFCPNWWHIRKMLYPYLWNTRKYNIFLVQNDVTYDNVISPNLRSPWKYDVFCPNLRYIRTCVMSKHTLHTNMRCILSELMLHTEMQYVRTYVTNENMMSCVRTYITYEKL